MSEREKGRGGDLKYFIKENLNSRLMTRFYFRYGPECAYENTILQKAFSSEIFHFF